MTDPNGPAFEAALSALKQGFEVKPASIGCGGSIGFVGPLAELFGGAPALLFGIEDPLSKAHAPNESLDGGDFRKLTASLAIFFDKVGKLKDVKAAPAAPAAPEPTAAPQPAVAQEPAPAPEPVATTEPAAAESGSPAPELAAAGSEPGRSEVRRV